MERKELPTETVEVLTLDYQQLRLIADENYDTFLGRDLFDTKSVKIELTPNLEVLTLPSGESVVVDSRVLAHIENGGDLSFLAPEGKRLTLETDTTAENIF